jgi:lysozyme family protein
MADFNIAYIRTNVFEGGYANNPLDKGGETYYGIARKGNPSWAGWEIIDKYRNEPNFPKNLEVPEVKSQLQNLKKILFKASYWNLVWGDKIKNQVIANDVFDTAINMGVGASIKLLYRQYNMPEKTTMSEELLVKLNEIL